MYGINTHGNGVVKSMERYAEVKRLISQEYCPVCYYANESSVKHFNWLFIEYYHSASFIRQLLHGGFCPRHTQLDGAGHNIRG